MTDKVIVTEHDCECNSCGAKFRIKSAVGPVNMCDDCSKIYLAFIHGDIDADTMKKRIRARVKSVGRGAIG